jgi:hypothetical protein
MNQQEQSFFFSKHQGNFFSGISLIVKQSTFIRFIINNFAKITYYFSYFLTQNLLFFFFFVLDESLAKDVVLEGRCSGVFFSKINIIIFEQITSHKK